MFVKPGRRQDDPALPLIVRGPNKRLLSSQGENVPEITFWYRRLRDGDVVLAEPPAPPPRAPRPAVTATVNPPVVDQAAARAAADTFVFPPPAPAGAALLPAAAEHDAAAPLPTHDEPSGQSPEGMPLAESKP